MLPLSRGQQMMAFLSSGWLLVTACWVSVVTGRQECFVDDGLLVFYPKNPFLFQGDSFQACCQFVNRSEINQPLDVSLVNETVAFSCGDDTSVESTATPIPTTTGSTIQKDIIPSSQAVCSRLRVNTSGRTTCRCAIAGWPRCNSHQLVTSDVRLPNELMFECITYAGLSEQNTTCRLELPAFAHRNRVNTTMTWTQTGQEETMSPECKTYDTCVLDKALLMLVTYNISVSVEYDTNSVSSHHRNGNDGVITLSTWKIYDPQKNILLDKVTPKVEMKNATSIRLFWDIAYNIFIPANKQTRINYRSKDPWSLVVGQQELFTDEMTFITSQSTILSDLSPLTRYEICVSYRFNTSRLWSEPGCVEVSTMQHVPSKSPDTSPDAFLVENSTHVLVYWKPLNEWDWKSPDGRRYVQQENQLGVLTPPWADRQDVNWTQVQTWVSVSGLPADVRLVAANNQGRAADGSAVIRIPNKENTSPGAQHIKAQFDSSTSKVKVTWQSMDNKAIPTIFWCQRGAHPNSCANVFDWSHPDVMGNNSVVIPMASSQQAGLYMYGVALSHTDGHGHYRSSGVLWQTCIDVLEGGTVSRLGTNCDPDVNKVSSHDTTPVATVVGIIAGIFVILLAVIGGVFCRNRRRKARKSLRLGGRDRSVMPSDRPQDNPSYEPVDIHPWGDVAGSQDGSLQSLVPNRHGFVHRMFDNLVYNNGPAVVSVDMPVERSGIDQNGDIVQILERRGDIERMGRGDDVGSGVDKGSVQFIDEGIGSGGSDGGGGGGGGSDGGGGGGGGGSGGGGGGGSDGGGGGGGGSDGGGGGGGGSDGGGGDGGGGSGDGGGGSGGGGGSCGESNCGDCSGSSQSGVIRGSRSNNDNNNDDDESDSESDSERDEEDKRKATNALVVHSNYRLPDGLRLRVSNNDSFNSPLSDCNELAQANSAIGTDNVANQEPTSSDISESGMLGQIGVSLVSGDSVDVEDGDVGGDSVDVEDGDVGGDSVDVEDGDVGGDSVDVEDGDVGGDSVDVEDGDVGGDSVDVEDGDVGGDSVDVEDGDVGGDSVDIEDGDIGGDSMDIEDDIVDRMADSDSGEMPTYLQMTDQLYGNGSSSASTNGSDLMDQDRGDPPTTMALSANIAHQIRPRRELELDANIPVPS